MRVPVAKAGLFASLLAVAGCSGCSSAGGDPRSTEGDTEATVEPYTIDPNPAVDDASAPYTGWTRAHYELAFARIIFGWHGTLSEGGAQTTLPDGEDLPAALEGAVRVMPLIAAWLSDPDNPSVISYEGRSLDLVEVVHTALVNGTDPTHSDYWGRIDEGWDQKSVEAAAVCEALLLANERVWSVFSPAERAQVFTWLSPATSEFANNWSLFVGLRNVTRRLFGAKADADLARAQMTRLDEFYLGDGWYSDGSGAQVDFYNGFVIHHLQAIWVLHDPEVSAARVETIRRRLRAYLVDLPYWYTTEGHRPPFGRSLAYREAHLSVLPLARRLGASPLDPGLERRLLSGALARHLGDDARSTDRMLDADDVIARGWWGADPRALESYQRPGSQNYASRALMVLMLPRDDPFWTAVEQPLPADDGDFEHVSLAPGFALSGIDDGAEVRLLSSVAAKGDASRYLTRYRKQFYSSRFYPDLVADGGVYPDDASASLQRFTLEPLPPRDMARDGDVAPGFARTVFDVPDAPPRTIVSTTWAHGDALVRWTCQTDGQASSRALEGGFAVAHSDQGTTLVDQTALARARIEVDPRGPSALGPVLVSSVRGLEGFDSTEARLDVPGVGPSNMIWAHSETPRLVGIDESTLGGEPWCGLAVVRGASTDTPPTEATLDAWTLGPVSNHQVAGRTAQFDGPDMQVWLAAEDQVTEHSITLGGLTFTGPLRFARVHTDGSGVVVAGGVRTVSDATGEVITLSAAGTLVLRRGPDRWEIETDQSFSVRRPFDVGSVRATLLDGGTVEVSGDVQDGPDGPDGPLVVPGALHDRFARDVDRSLARFELHLAN